MECLIYKKLGGVDNSLFLIEDSFSRKIVDKYGTNPNIIGYHAIVEDIVVGYLLVLNNYLAGFFVEKEFRNNGLGTELLKRALEDLNHYDFIYGYIHKPAVNIFKKQQFQILYQVNASHWILYKGNIDDKSFVQIKSRWSEMNN